MMLTIVQTFTKISLNNHVYGEHLLGIGKNTRYTYTRSAVCTLPPICVNTGSVCLCRMYICNMLIILIVDKIDHCP